MNPETRGTPKPLTKTLDHRLEPFGKIEARELLMDSWLLDGIDSAIKEWLVGNPDFMINGGLWVLPLPSVFDKSMAYERHQAHVVRSLASWNKEMRYHAYQRYEWGGGLTSIIPWVPEEEVLCSLYFELYSGLIAELGQGKDIRDLAPVYLRPFSWGVESHLPGEITVNRYVGTSKRNRELPIRTYSPFKAARVINLISRFSRPEQPILSNDELNQLNEAMLAGFQPFIEINPPTWKFNWRELNFGAQLEALSYDEILALANGDYCNGACQFYHSHVEKLKKFGELIAPVDAEFFGACLLNQYQEWKKHNKEGRFRALIPAQADETTIGGILDYLNGYGIPQEEIIENFSFQLADLCVTPLLRVYAELKYNRDGLLDAMGESIQIRSMDVFRWQKETEEDETKKFDSIFCDHFIDLFPPVSQRELLLSLSKSLTPGGQLVLTARCGSFDKPLSAQNVLAEFYKKVDEHILRLMTELEESRRETLGTRLTSEEVTADVHELIALLFYRQLREVYPFETKKQLFELLAKVKDTVGESVDYRVLQLEEGKVVIIITKE